MWDGTAEGIAALKEEDGPELQVHGSGNLVRALLRHNLVDQFRLWVFPLVIGSGKRLFSEGTSLIEESGQRPDPGEARDDERRRYYRLTGFGGEVLAAEVERLDALVRAARRKGAFPAPSPEGA